MGFVICIIVFFTDTALLVLFQLYIVRVKVSMFSKGFV